MTSRIAIAVLGVTAALGVPGRAAEEGADDRFTVGKMFNRGKVLILPEREERLGPEGSDRPWDLAGPNRGGFTVFDGTDGLTITDDKTLKFKMGSGSTLLGWGNYGNQQAVRDRVQLWTRVSVKLEVRQSVEGPTQWKARLWAQGKRDGNPKGASKANYDAEVEGTEWQEVAFNNMVHTPGPDGFDIKISAPAGTEVEIRKLTLCRGMHEGYFRKEFLLPDGKIWRAIVDVGVKTLLYVNGQEIEDKTAVRPRPIHGYSSVPLDITEYLKPGRNCIGLYGTSLDSVYPPYVFLQGRAVMASGEIILLDSDESWKWTPEAGDGWSKPGFDDSGWTQVSGKRDKAPDNAKALVGGSWMRSYRDRNWSARPGYNGYLVMENPYDNRLFYSDSKPVRVKLRMPNGLESRRPVVEWRITRWAKGAETEVGKGRVDEFEYRKASLVFEVRPGRLPRGVYVLYTRLLSGEDVIEERIPEPLVVVGRLPMKEVSGDFYEQGMDLVLEDVVDFTDPEDPHPVLESDGKGEALRPHYRTAWKELSERQQASTSEEEWNERQARHAQGGVKQPLIVERKGLKYRETQPNMGAHFSTLVEFEHPGDFYVMVLEYPNDKARWIGAACTESGGGVGGTSKCCPVAWTGDKYPLTGKMQEMKWIYRPDPGKHAIDIMSLRRFSAAAASKLSIYHAAGGLPALRAPEEHRRWLGILTETSDWRQSFEETMRVQPFEPFHWWKPGHPEPDPRPVVNLCKLFEGWLDSAESYAAYLRFTGQNMHVMGCWQYSDMQAMLAPPQTDSPRLLPAFRELTARVFRENDIDFRGSVQFVFSTGLAGMLEGQRETMPGIWDTMYMVDKEGRELAVGKTASYRTGWNFNHPQVREAMLRVVDDIGAKFAGLPNFLGLNWSVYFGCDYLPVYRCQAFKANSPYLDGNIVDPLDDGYGDVTIMEFEKDTGIKLPIGFDDPSRFRKRYELLTSDRMLRRWVHWRCERLRDCFGEIAKRIQKGRADLDCVASLMFYAGHAKEWRASGLSLEDFMTRWGWDPALFRTDPDIWPTHWMHASPHAQPVNNVNYLYGLDINVAPEFFKTFESEMNRSTMIQYSWQEPEGYGWRLPFRQGWPRAGNILAQAVPGGEYANEAFTQALIGGDPRLVMFALLHVNLVVGHEQQLRDFARVLRSLPPEKFTPVDGTGFESNLAIRELRRRGRLYFYVVNPGYWPIEGAVTVTGVPSVRDLVGGDVAAGKGLLGGDVKVPVKLGPYGVKAFVADAPDAAITGWANERVAEKHLAHMRGIMEQVSDLLAIPEARVVLTPDEQVFMRGVLADATADLEAGHYARAWSSLGNSSRYRLLWQEYLRKGAEFGTEKKTSEALNLERKTLGVQRTANPPTVDGRLDDEAWKSAVPVGGFIMPGKRPCIAATFVQAVHDEGNLYLAFSCKDRRPGELKHDAEREREGSVFGDDCVAMFLQPDLGKDDYYQMAFSAGAVKFDQRVVGGSKDYAFAPDWDVATAVTGDGWVAEVRMPADALGGRIEEGRAWGGNFHRAYRYKKVPNSSWSYTQGSWHEVEGFGRIEFE